MNKINFQSRRGREKPAEREMPAFPFKHNLILTVSEFWRRNTNPEVKPKIKKEVEE
jgi:hypothetical protein